MESFKKLKAYQSAIQQANEIYKVSLHFPKEENYSLTNQIRRSSRSVCANLAEGYRKRMYKPHFILKITDADAENSETSVWLDFAEQCGYLNGDLLMSMREANLVVGRLLGHMLRNPGNYMDVTPKQD